MTVIDSLKKRKSVRAFLKKEVEIEKINTILESAILCPSGVNMQPFEVYVVSGDKKLQIENKMLEAFDNNQKEKMDYQYYPLEWIEPFKSRRKELGLLLYSTLGITKDDKEKQINQWKSNYKAFGAPTVIYFFMDSSLDKGSYIDYGIFLQSIMLVATQLGLATCPMASLAEFPTIVKNELNIPKDKILVCGIAIGYEDEIAIINSFKSQRIKLEEFTKFYK
jgi:nitroreductase